MMSRISIQSKLLAMLLLTSVLSAAVVGYIGYQSGRDSLRTAVFEQLTESRAAQARTLQVQLRFLRESLIVYTKSTTAVDAARAFTAGFEDLRDAVVEPDQQQSITAWYEKHFSQPQHTRGGTEVDIEGLLPTSNPQKYLQATYTARFSDWDEAIAFNDARDGTPWSAAHSRFHYFFRDIVTRFRFEDALLFDTRGNVVYSTYKGADLGTNIYTGPYRSSNLAETYEEALESNTVDYVATADFASYQPAGAPTAWLMSPIGTGGRIDGVLALQFPISGVNNIMTMEGDWEQAGMGQTGETYLIGPDGLMRSDSRLFLEDPEEFKRQVIDAGTSPETAQKSLDKGGTTLVQPAEDEASRRAQRGQSGSIIEADYLGNQTLQSYAPLNLPGLSWGVVAKINTAEAFAPVTAFTRNLVLSTVAIIFVVCIAAILCARLFVRPIRRLETGAHQISSGNLGVTIPVRSRDEFGDLTVAFNEMSRNLRIKEDLLEEQRRENDRLLLTMMPETVVQRYREGQEIIADDHQNVTVIFADLIGLDELSSDELITVVNNLMRQFDAAADKLGIEQVRTLHNGYLAGCGLTVPRLDNVRRTVDFAVEMQRIVDRFRSESGRHVFLRAGVDTGTVSSGLVGRSNLAYDMWGSAVDLAYRAQSGARESGIYVSDRVREATQDSRQFTAAGSVRIDDTDVLIWRLTERQP